MLREFPLDTAAAIRYARTWAFARNPRYYNFDAIGGDCTNYVSQCLHAGGAVMNFTPDTGWYYISAADRAPAWTGVEFFYRFLTGNQGIGPFAIEVIRENIRPGDVVQLGNRDRFYHSLLVVDVRSDEPYLAAHTRDAFAVPLSSYRFARARYLRIPGYRKDV